jgi:hypothetical protein
MAVYKKTSRPKLFLITATRDMSSQIAMNKEQRLIGVSLHVHEILKSLYAL